MNKESQSVIEIPYRLVKLATHMYNTSSIIHGITFVWLLNVCMGPIFIFKDFEEGDAIRWMMMFATMAVLNELTYWLCPTVFVASFGNVLNCRNMQYFLREHDWQVFSAVSWTIQMCGTWVQISTLS